MPQVFSHLLQPVFKKRIPGQLVVQFTDRCNATCPQCGMRVGEPYPRSTLACDTVKQMIDAAAAQGVRAISFTGGEPLLHVDQLVEMIDHAGKAGIAYIRTGTNGFVFRNAHRPGFHRRIATLAAKLARTRLRNFWISIDSADGRVHETMRGLSGVIAGIEKALPIFHDHGLYPSANLGINRNLDGDATGRLHPSDFPSQTAYLRAFAAAFRRGFERFYRFAIDLGFTMVNTCYPMSIGDNEQTRGLAPVYAASAVDAVIRFDAMEKAQLFRTLMDTIPGFRSRIRIFSPLCSLHALERQYAQGAPEATYPCHGGLDFFFVEARGGNTYPCGYRGNENFGKFWHMNLHALQPQANCRRCDWECFRDPSEMFGPILEGVHAPWRLADRFLRDPHHLKLWLSDLRYYRACAFFDGRRPPDYGRLSRF